jgi:hypothetical protein
LIKPQDIDELSKSDVTRGIPEWCGENGVEENALLRVVETYGADPNPPAAVVCAFQLGYEVRKQKELDRPPALGGSREAVAQAPRYEVMHVVVDTEDGSVVAGPTSQPDFVDDVAATFNEVNGL